MSLCRGGILLRGSSVQLFLFHYFSTRVFLDLSISKFEEGKSIGSGKGDREERSIAENERNREQKIGRKKKDEAEN
jgi:hypothetical protein